MIRYFSWLWFNKCLSQFELNPEFELNFFQEIEGSGVPPSLSNRQKGDGTGSDIEWDGSGISPDDEDGDVVEGSGAHIG